MAQTELSHPAQLFLAQSDDTRDRTLLAEQKNLPASIQRMLAQDPSPKVRRRLASNPQISPSIALHIASSSDLGACRALAKNPGIDDTVLTELCQHPEDAIALLVSYREDLKPEHYDCLVNARSSTVVAEHLAYQEVPQGRFQADIAEALAAHPAPSLRAYVAHSGELKESTRHQLLQDPSPKVRKALASNPALSDHQLQHLLADPDREVLFAAEETFAQRLRQRQPEAPETKSAASPSKETARPQRGALFNRIAQFFTE